MYIQCIYTTCHVTHYYGEVNWRGGLRIIAIIAVILVSEAPHWMGYTSSTAQGGGGSFKDSTPIGEVGCCDAWMAEWTHWWIERWPRGLSLSFSLSPACLFPTLSIFLSLSACLFVLPFPWWPIYIYIYIPSVLSMFLSLYLTNHQSMYFAVLLSIHLPIYRLIPTHFSVYL